METFDNETCARLLQFVTGTSKVPMNGFSELQGTMTADILHAIYVCVATQVVMVPRNSQLKRLEQLTLCHVPILGK